MPESSDCSMKISQVDPRYELNKEALRTDSKFAT